MVSVFSLREPASWCFDMAMLEMQQELKKNNSGALNFALKLISIQNLRNSKLTQIDIRNLRFVSLTNLLHLRNNRFHSQSTVTKLASMEVLELLLSNISEAVTVCKCDGLFSFNSCIRGFHAYDRHDRGSK